MNDEQHKRDHEQHVGDLRGNRCHARHAERSRDQPDDEKYQRVIQHSSYLRSYAQQEGDHISVAPHLLNKSATSLGAALEANELPTTRNGRAISASRLALYGNRLHTQVPEKTAENA